MLRWILLALASLLVSLSGVWGALALWYQAPGGVLGRWLGLLGWSLSLLLLLAWSWMRRPWLPLGIYLAGFVLLLWWWASIAPSNDRAWADDVARMVSGQVEGDQVLLRDVRDFDWRSDEDYDARWETRRYDLRTLRSADLILSYWGSAAIAHAMISFGFADGRQLVFSVEIRKRRGQQFSSIGGFFKQYERIVIAADEHDIVRVRTNVRGEDDYLYPLRMTPPQLRALFLSYVAEANQRQYEPAWYNTVTSNCTTIVYGMARQIEPGLPVDYRLLLTGYLPSYLHAVGALDPALPLATLTARGHITARARATLPGEDFSAAIRREPGAAD